MKCNNGLCYTGDNDATLCCGCLNWKKAILLIALGDVISVSFEAYGASGSTLGDIETRMGISHFFNITIPEGGGSSSTYYSIYVMGFLLFILRILTICSLVLGAQNYRPCNVLVWIISAPIGWVIFFIMQVVLLERYYGENNQASKFWSIWNDRELFSLNSTSKQMTQ